MSNEPDVSVLPSPGGPFSGANLPGASVPAPVGGWLRAGRKARGVSQQQLAEKLGFKRQAWAQLEASEAREAISLYSLRRAADALGYDLVYYLVPRDGEFPNGEGRDGPVAAGRDARPAWQTQDLPTELR